MQEITELFEKEPEILSIRDVARLLRSSVSSVERWRKTRGIPSYKDGESGKRKFFKKDIIAYIQSLNEKYV